MSSFLVRYNRRTGDVQVQEFHGEEGRREALAARVQDELTRSSDDVEIAVLASDSLDELKRTHGRYFRTASQLLGDYRGDPEQLTV